MGGQPIAAPEDGILPVQIEHKIDEIWFGAELQERYNFLDYHFEAEGAYCRARAYADEMAEVTLYGPLEHRQSITEVASPAFEQKVVVYLKRRFLKVIRP